jgi:hypothetical protein
MPVYLMTFRQHREEFRPLLDRYLATFERFFAYLRLVLVRTYA